MIYLVICDGPRGRPGEPSGAIVQNLRQGPAPGFADIAYVAGLRLGFHLAPVGHRECTPGWRESIGARNPVRGLWCRGLAPMRFVARLSSSPEPPASVAGLF